MGKALVELRSWLAAAGRRFPRILRERPWEVTVPGLRLLVSVPVPKPNRGHWSPLILFTGASLAGIGRGRERQGVDPEDKRKTSNTPLTSEKLQNKAFQTPGCRAGSGWQTCHGSIYLYQTDVQGHPRVRNELETPGLNETLVESTFCFPRGFKFSLQHPCQAAHSCLRLQLPCHLRTAASERTWTHCAHSHRHKHTHNFF